MLTNQELQVRLRSLGLTNDEAALYLELLKGPGTHLHLSRATGIDRAKIYRVAERLQKRSLLTRMTDDRGTFLVAADPTHLEVDLVAQEESLRRQRKMLQAILPALTGAQLPTPGAFRFKTYTGQAGIKQMCWNELNTKGEIITFGHGNIETLTNDRSWSARHRLRQIDAGYRNRDLVNEGKASRSTLASEKLYEAGLYQASVLPANVLRFGAGNQTVVYNDVVEIFSWQDGQRAGIEIISPSYAALMRQLFEHYWGMAYKVRLSAAA